MERRAGAAPGGALRNLGIPGSGALGGFLGRGAVEGLGVGRLAVCAGWALGGGAVSTVQQDSGDPRKRGRGLRSRGQAVLEA